MTSAKCLGCVSTYNGKTLSIEHNMTSTVRHDLITPAKLHAWNAGWDGDRIATYFADRTEIPARQIATDDTLHINDRMWVLTNALARKDKLLPYKFALWCAERSLARLTPEWQTKLEPVFVQVRDLGHNPSTADARVANASVANARAAARAARAAAHVAYDENAANTAYAAARAADAVTDASVAARGAYDENTAAAIAAATAIAAADSAARASIYAYAWDEVCAHAVNLLKAPVEVLIPTTSSPIAPTSGQEEGAL